MTALNSYLSPKDIPLSYLLLDPNNPRFVTSDFELVSDQGASQQDTQKSLQDKLLKEFAAEKLKENMEINGYLPIDRIVVRPIGSEAYVVLEGNRRIAAAKKLSEQIVAGAVVDEGVTESLNLIPSLVYTGEDNSAAWLFQGLRHITGISDWSAYHKARLLVEQMDKDGLSLTEVGKRFGLTAYGAGQWARGYYAFQQASEETDYVKEIDERVYPYFQELFGRSSIAMKDWLGWNDTNKRFENASNLNEFVSWFYPRSSLSEGQPDDQHEIGDWDKRIISKRDDIRQLSYIISNSNVHFLKFRQERDIEAAYNAALLEKFEKEKRTKTPDEIFDLIEKCTDQLENLPFKIMKDSNLKQRYEDLIEKLKASIEATV